MPDQLARRFDLGCAFGEPKTHRLVVEDRLPKTLPVLGIGQRDIERAACHADALRSNADAPPFETAQGNAIALPFAADQVFHRYPAVVKIDLRGVAGMLTDLVFYAGHHIARRLGRHQEGTHAFLAGAFVGDRNHNRYVTVFATGDELLDAIDDVAVAIAHGSGAQRRGVRPDVRLGQAESAQQLALRQRRQPLLLLCCIAIAHEDGVDRAVGDADNGAGATVAGSNFFQHQRQREVVQPGAAERLGHTNTVGTQRCQATMGVFGKQVLTVPFRRIRPQLGLRKIAHRVADHFLVLA